MQGPGRIEGSARLLIDLVNGKLPVLVDTHLSIVDIDDCTRAHLLAETHGVAGRRYLVSGASLTTPEAVQLLRDACGHPKRARYAPRSVITFAGAFGGVLTWLTHRDLPLCSESTRVLLHGHRYDGSLAERELGLGVHAGRGDGPAHARLVRRAGTGPRAARVGRRGGGGRRRARR